MSKADQRKELVKAVSKAEKAWYESGYALDEADEEYDEAHKALIQFDKEN